ncbi:hypothetical protein DFQ11_10114 [Winogradskyella epiphytica]|uniref:Uncharacterized protein n=1 Tax=Winogradskyella epiphytica TaxID=262005 RepID=A0A2V4XKI9_9FLAO|nr:hypothetical protein [Winogradskyella epiphytica]PYE82589.1 hypothetical protein DFQ11_10114 [Winogradskyella epiphytica]
MKSIKLLGLILLSFTLLNTQCEEDDVYVASCDLSVIVDNEVYNTIESDDYTLNDYYFIGDCLKIIIDASGCDTSNWEMTLVDSENIGESIPHQRFLKLSVITNQACQVVFSKTVSFDVKSLRLPGVNEVVLNIEGFNESILYSY